MKENAMDYLTFFQRATAADGRGLSPYPYQQRLAVGARWPDVLRIPTGVGKTAAAVLGWLYRRREAPEAVRQATPRRLAYCLPMRTLVEQTVRETRQWLRNLGYDSSEGVGVHVLMGGAGDTDWDEHPERDAILIGTQDMMLSRALNRGYGMSRYGCPVHFALLNNDCQWVFDETQLLGVGLTTSAQLAGLRRRLATFGNCATMWMSATLDKSALSTVDHPLPPSGQWAEESLGADDRDQPSIQRLLAATKPCQQATTQLASANLKQYGPSLAAEVLERHVTGTLTLVVVNRVSRAQQVFLALQSAVRNGEHAPDLQLVHSRFRPRERREIETLALEDSQLPPGGRILVTTQAVEAGVDLSATTLLTELAPWSSLVQLCTRRSSTPHRA